MKNTHLAEKNVCDQNFLFSRGKATSQKFVENPTLWGFLGYLIPLSFLLPLTSGELSLMSTLASRERDAFFGDFSCLSQSGYFLVSSFAPYHRGSFFNVPLPFNMGVLVLDEHFTISAENCVLTLRRTCSFELRKIAQKIPKCI